MGALRYRAVVFCPSCRRPTRGSGRICPHCGLELPGRTRLGVTFPPGGTLGSTMIGPPPLEGAGAEADAGQTPSEAPHARRFETAAAGTWFGHLPSSGEEAGPPSEPGVQPPAGPSAVTHASTARVTDEAWFRVRGAGQGRARPVRAAPQRRPWPRFSVWGVVVPYWVLFASIGTAALGGACAARFFPRPPALKVIGFEVTADGKDRLTVSCGSCPDGSTLRLGHARATLSGGVAHLVSSGLEVGENRLPIELEVPGAARARIDVTVALAFRVSTDLRGITEVPPQAMVVVTAPRGTSVIMGGTPVPSEPGVFRSRVELSELAQGPEARALSVERKVPVRVLGPDLERSTHATIAATAVPLVLDRGPTYENGHLAMGGRTSPLATVQLLQGGAALARQPADASGRFYLWAPGARPGPALVTASAKGHLSRQVACQLPAPAPGPSPSPASSAVP